MTAAGDGRSAALRMAQRSRPEHRVRDLEQELEALHERVKELELRKQESDHLAAIAAHELMEPLVMAEAYAGLLVERLGETLEPSARSDLEAFTRGTSRMRLLVETLLHDARSATREPQRSAVDLQSVMDDCIGLLRPEITARQARIHVGRLPTVSADAALMGSVIKNLLVNALKYGPRHGGEIRVRGSRTRTEWRIAISSEGPPIPEEDHGRIFELFARGRAERRVEGSGIGLAVCRRIVERHGGRIDVEPWLGRGNTFAFTLPR